ncbi:glutathione S-transferase [Povalibacter sp.]|uniref:glutathione S-transferase n=1 Tax=Povalibacter sp. TaxID=1962978 RepID=UPI002F416CF2
MYELHYWPGIQGRGEFVRLALEYAGVDYIDVARADESHDGGEEALMKRMQGADLQHPPFAPPWLKVGDQLIGQTANILLFLGRRHGLAPKEEAGELWTHQLQLTIADFIVEIHDVHHPIGSGLYYEDQRDEARRRARDFRDNRVPKFLKYFATVLQRNPAGDLHLVGSKVTYADLSLFQVIAGLRYAFPNLMRSTAKQYRQVMTLHDRTAAEPRLASYFASARRIAFNQEGIFRHYPELDSAAT